MFCSFRWCWYTKNCSELNFIFSSCWLTVGKFQKLGLIWQISKRDFIALLRLLLEVYIMSDGKIKRKLFKIWNPLMYKIKTWWITFWIASKHWVKRFTSSNNEILTIIKISQLYPYSFVVCHAQYWFESSVIRASKGKEYQGLIM